MNKHVLRTKQKESQILNATIQLVGREPLEQITIDKIKNKAKVSQVTIYKLFFSKDNLIDTAIKMISLEAVNSIMNVIGSDLKPKERLEGYFRTSFKTAFVYPRQRHLVDYILSGIHPNLTNYVLKLYEETYPLLQRLYNDCRNEKLIRDEITFNKFTSMCDMYTKVDPIFYSNSDDLEMLIRSIIKSFG